MVGFEQQEIEARLDAHRDFLANLVAAIARGRPDLDAAIAAALLASVVEAPSQQKVAAYLAEIGALRDLIEPVLSEYRSEHKPE